MPPPQQLPITVVRHQLFTAHIMHHHPTITVPHQFHKNFIQRRRRLRLFRRRKLRQPITTTTTTTSCTTTPSITSSTTTSTIQLHRRQYIALRSLTYVAELQRVIVRKASKMGSRRAVAGKLMIAMVKMVEKEKFWHSEEKMVKRATEVRSPSSSKSFQTTTTTKKSFSLNLGFSKINFN